MKSNPIKVDVSNKQGQLGFVFTKGGLREGAGRKSIGVTKKVSLTLTEEIWEKIEAEREEHNQSRSEIIRSILESYYYPINTKGKATPT
ncbi:ribbon-helix-helix protein, CopG family [Saccharibacillus sp. CPCC 101409]|uniref:ribbon-helix-helix protein, CopG family n=1 Tax=Saccharibacillus sp. CPCC 101409 TaxID=3058041 RepID=UPI0026718EE4|nr:ribbon-helix-helix protein, CopG family [Saccharibacillus sp. CPCC 101409]MDO3409744.1 ribbon-helix-helix protein, CopG family [Saccharibacillus sp. CPCC 101409]